MSSFRIVVTMVTLIYSISLAQEGKNKDTQPQLSIQQSSYVEFKSSNITASSGTISFDGKFIVLGDAIYGHFDMVASSDSDKVIQNVMSENRAWKRDHGGNLKTIMLSMNAVNAVKVVVSFHEMRLHPDEGACKQ
ncbi:MAG TPA: hypothetical protein VHO70_20475 [Chitinispirillaceae bacterium]|nr:hypothetical protein [Chitinispirillaceae bacterium]